LGKSVESMVEFNVRICRLKLRFSQRVDTISALLFIDTWNTVKSSLTVKRAEVDAYIENPAVPKENVR
jgi:hypothetical protein